MINKRFIEQFEENVQRYPDKVILRDEHNSLTFRELDELSGRVYAYLKEKGIGREDFVMIHLPYGIKPYIAMMGVWKAGAACVVNDITIGSERLSIIYKDCGCVSTINSDIWDKILKVEALNGHEETDPHDVAFAVYTSGSEGRPKGVMHEYGYLEFTPSNLNAIITSRCSTPLPLDTVHYCYVPISTIGAIIVISMSAWHPMTSDIGSLALMKNPQELMKYIEKRGVTVLFMLPSYYIYNKIHVAPSVVVYMSSEPLKNIYSEQPRLLNIHIQSEGYHICAFRVDKLYENTPIGKPTNSDMVMLYDDEDQPVEQGDLGELCYKNPYFRGYINDEENTKNSFINGYFRSGDIARINEDGNYVILGRKSDMIKINGNRIEPAEIEAAVKRVLGIDWAFAKGFVEKDRSYIVVYYTADINLPSPQREGTGVRLSHIREQLLNILPTYMIPSYFVHLNEVPHLPNGKVDRQALRAPEIEQYRAEYVAPENDIEEQLCAQMERILGTRIGALDDFYLMGGDSLRTIQLVTNLRLDSLTVTDIYAARTPRSIAARLQSRTTISPSSEAPSSVSGASSSSSAATSSASAPHQAPTAPHQPAFLLPYSQMVYDLEQQMPGVYTFPFTLEYDSEQIDTARLNTAIATAIAAHPVFEGNEQYYSIEAMEVKGEEEKGYLKMRLNRILGDGYSFGILLEDICRAYHGLPIPEDHYIDYLAEYKNHTQSPEYAEHRDALVAHYADCGSDACPVRPTLDKEIEEGDEWLAGEYSLPLSKATWGKGATQWRDRGYSMNERVCLATALAIMDYCGTDAAALTWAYLGRENEQQMHIFGSLHKDIPLRIERPLPRPLSIDERGDVMKKMLEQVRKEMQQGIIMSDYPYTLTQPYQDTWAYAVNVLQQPRMEDINLHGLEFTPSSAPAPHQAPTAPHQSYSLLDIEIEDNQLRIKYSATHYRESSIARFAELIQKYI